jgi:L-histidine Nalpha-methyltransferase / hercynylcysteine S-oxide synthase
LWLAFEHEAMHLETYLYMLLQHPKILPPAGSDRPDFRQIAEEAETKAVTNEWFEVPQSTIKIGLDDAENDLGPDRYFGWDNEKPRRQAVVDRFEAQGRPISNDDYVKYLLETRSTSFPASWIRTPTIQKGVDGGHGETDAAGMISENSTQTGSAGSDWLKKVSLRTVYGPVPLEYVLHWPVMASYNELAAYAKWAGGRIPTMEEARSIDSHVGARKQEIAEQVPSSLISAVNG